MNINKQKLISDGFLGFNLKELDLKLYDELYSFLSDISYLENSIKTLKISAEFTIDTYDFYKKIEKECSELIVKNKEYLHSKNKSIKELQNENWNPNFIDCLIPCNNYENLIKLKNYIFENYLKKQNQSWFIGDINHDFEELIQNIQKQILYYFYGDVLDIDKIFPPYNYSPIELTLFPKESLIEKHRDGRNENRVCAILIYLNKDWKEEYGGNLKLFNNNKETTIVPYFGNVAILDFTKNNVEHEVTKVLVDKNRYAVLSFLHI
jgi:Rps23 Pro-64 3,4-dihydroxylase Tpa1-like proline 4-hydroxylase